MRLERSIKEFLSKLNYFNNYCEEGPDPLDDIDYSSCLDYYFNRLTGEIFPSILSSEMENELRIEKLRFVIDEISEKLRSRQNQLHELEAELVIAKEQFNSLPKESVKIGDDKNDHSIEELECMIISEQIDRVDDFCKALSDYMTESNIRIKSYIERTESRSQATKSNGEVQELKDIFRSEKVFEDLLIWLVLAEMCNPKDENGKYQWSGGKEYLAGLAIYLRENNILKEASTEMPIDNNQYLRGIFCRFFNIKTSDKTFQPDRIDPNKKARFRSFQMSG